MQCDGPQGKYYIFIQHKIVCSIYNTTSLLLTDKIKIAACVLVVVHSKHVRWRRDFVRRGDVGSIKSPLIRERGL